MNKTIALDASLLVLLVVGLTKPEYISAHKRLKEYTVDDFYLLMDAINRSAGIVVTPNALSEASNLLRQINDPAKGEISLVFQKFIENTNEIYVKSADASIRSEFVSLGLADSALLEIGRNDIVVLTADLDLCVAAEISGYRAINFNHIRDDFYNAQVE